MGSIRTFSSLNNLSSLSDVVRYVSSWVQAAATQVNGKLEFVKNIRAAGPYTALVPVAPDVVEVAHNFGSVPQGLIIIKQTAAASIYAPDPANTIFSGVTRYAWTDTKVWLTADQGVVATFYLV